jgi:hypothetical protein
MKIVRVYYMMIFLTDMFQKQGIIKANIFTVFILSRNKNNEKNTKVLFPEFVFSVYYLIKTPVVFC